LCSPGQEHDKMIKNPTTFSMACPGSGCEYRYKVTLLKVNEVETCPVCGYTADFNLFVTRSEPVESGNLMSAPGYSEN
jgi:hypothetical protein